MQTKFVMMENDNAAKTIRTPAMPRQPLVLSKYERVQVLASRVEELLAGAPRLVDIETDDITAIAEEEIARRLLPMRVARALPNSKVRVHDLRDFIDPRSMSDPSQA